MKIHPALVGILNALIPGLGYLLIRERVVFGAGLLIAIVLFAFMSFTDPSPALDTLLFAVTPVGRIFETLSYAILFLVFGYDAYDLARKKRSAVTTLMKV